MLPFAFLAVAGLSLGHGLMTVRRILSEPPRASVDSVAPRGLADPTGEKPDETADVWTACRGECSEHRAADLPWALDGWPVVHTSASLAAGSALGCATTMLAASANPSFPDQPGRESVPARTARGNTERTSPRTNSPDVTPLVASATKLDRRKDRIRRNRGHKDLSSR